MRTGGERSIGIGIVLAMLAVCRGALGQPTSLAQALFDEGRQLLLGGNVPAACAKFAESQRLEPAGGTLLNLAACHAREGRTASAWAEFGDALAAAERDGREDRVLEAKRQRERLEPHLARLTVLVRAPVPKAIEVRLDGTSLGAASWGVAMPVDPGEHDITAAAAGYVGWKGRALVGAEGTAVVEVPWLAPAAPEAPPPPAASNERPATTGTPDPGLAAYVFAAGGIAGVSLGTVFGLLAADKKNASASQCTPQGCFAGGVSLLRDAERDAWVSDFAFGAGIASLAAAAYLFFAPRNVPAPTATRGPRVSAAIGPRALALVGGWPW
jgi:hypothetical protein